MKMLKRYQVMLPDWLEEHVEKLVEKYDLSFSEVIRAQLCCWILTVVSHLYPEHKAGLKLDEIFEMIENDSQKNMERVLYEFRDRCSGPV